MRPAAFGFLFLALSALAPPSQASITFTPPTVYESGVITKWVGIADFDRDGNQDLAITEPDSTSLVLLFGRGDGTFSSRKTILMGAAPSAGAIADLNEDGYVDLVLASPSGVMVRHGAGDGTFPFEQDYPTSARPVSLAIADLDEDGKPDIVFPDGGLAVHVVWEKAPGGFSPESTWATNGDHPNDLVVEDLNHDGHLDVATSDYGHAVCCWHVSVLLGHGGRTIGPAVRYGASMNPVCIAAGDLDQDGAPDLFDAGDLGACSALINRGDATFDLAGTFAGVGTDGLWDAALADLDMDRVLDIIAATSNGVLLVRGTGDAQFTLDNTLVLSTIPRMVVVEDLDHDTRPDIVTAGNGVHVFLNATPTVGAPLNPLRVTLEAPRPNPARHQVAFEFSLVAAATGSLVIYDLAGRLVRTLTAGPLESGLQRTTWDLRSEAGRTVRPGIYFARFQAGTQHVVRRFEVIP